MMVKFKSGVSYQYYHMPFCSWFLVPIGESLSNIVSHPRTSRNLPLDCVTPGEPYRGAINIFLCNNSFKVFDVWFTKSSLPNLVLVTRREGADLRQYFTHILWDFLERKSVFTEIFCYCLQLFLLNPNEAPTKF
jgi:hypothetical protein